MRQTPFEVWGDDLQIRNWTYIDGIVWGMLLAAERVDNGRAVNFGTMGRGRILEAVRMLLK